MNKSSVLLNMPIVKAHPIKDEIVKYFESGKGETFGKVRVDQCSPVINNNGPMKMFIVK
jgi:hypothetical protein